MVATLGNTVEVAPLDPRRLEPIVGHDRVERLVARGAELQAQLGARRIVNVNSTAAGDSCFVCTCSFLARSVDQSETRTSGEDEA